MKQYVLALDEGTTGARAILFDKKANCVAMAQHEFAQYYPRAGWVEQDPMEIYASQYAALTECIAKSGIAPEEIVAVGITNQRETVVAWDKTTGKPVYNAIVWQCRRTFALCDARSEKHLRHGVFPFDAHRYAGGAKRSRYADHRYCDSILEVDDDGRVRLDSSQPETEQ